MLSCVRCEVTYPILDGRSTRDRTLPSGSLPTRRLDVVVTEGAVEATEKSRSRDGELAVLNGSRPVPVVGWSCVDGVEGRYASWSGSLGSRGSWVVASATAPRGPEEDTEGWRVELCREMIVDGAWELFCEPMRLGSSIPPPESTGGSLGTWSGLLSLLSLSPDASLSRYVGSLDA